MAADQDPFFSFPRLYGAPAYARPPRAATDSERPIDPDDLPIAAEQTAEERALSAALVGPFGERADGGDFRAAGPADPAELAGGPWGREPAGRRLTLGAIAGRMAPRRR